MKVAVYPNQTAPGNPVLDVYPLQAGTLYQGPPDVTLQCGDVWFGSSYNSNFVIGEDGSVYCVVNGRDIIRFTPPVPDGVTPEIIYHHNTWIRRLQLRMVQNVERLYFSAQAPSTPDDQNRVRIYWLDDNGGAHLYWEVGKTNLLVPNPCVSGEDFAIFYVGDFTFGENNTLYLSNGNSSPCGIFRVSGATPDSVSGTPERIFVTDACCMSDLQYDGEDGLLFTDYSDAPANLPYRLRRFDMGTTSTEIIWNQPGTHFRGFTVYPKEIFNKKFSFITKKSFIHKISSYHPPIPPYNEHLHNTISRDETDSSDDK